MEKKETKVLDPSNAISPIDGRYCEKTRELAEYFSEYALMRYRLLVSVEYFIFLINRLLIISPIPKGVRLITSEEIIFLRGLYQKFSESEFERIKQWEKVTNHDVNAVVRYFKNWLESNSLKDLAEFAHFGPTSEDINNTSFAFMLRGGASVLMKEIRKTNDVLMNSFVKPYADVPMLAHTHGQPASTTTVGWEMNVFFQRFSRQLVKLMGYNILVKFGGATGGHNSLKIAYPQVDWREFSLMFVNHLSMIEWEGNMMFEYNPYTAQIEPHDTYAELFDIVKRIDTIGIDLSRDMWMYIMLEVLVQKPVKGEDGSTAMPHKVNPIDFENGEGNFAEANAMFNFFCSELPVSRLQRHLTDSTIIRNFGTAFAHVLIAFKSLQKGLSKVNVNERGVAESLGNNWEIVSEAYQTILRREGIKGGYDILKEATRGKKVTEKSMHRFITRLAKRDSLSPELVTELKAITPHNYIGDRRII